MELAHSLIKCLLDMMKFLQRALPKAVCRGAACGALPILMQAEIAVLEYSLYYCAFLSDILPSLFWSSVQNSDENFDLGYLPWVPLT